VGLVLAATLSGSCKKRRTPVASVPPVTSRPAVPDAGLQVATPAPDFSFTPEDLLVGTNEALEIWTRGGVKKGVLSAGAARYPHAISPREILVLRTRGDSVGEGATLEVVDTVGGRRRAVAEIPPFHCEHAPSDEAKEGSDDVDLQDETGFQIDLRQQRACLTLMDRNSNMANLALDVTVDLKTGKVHRWLSVGAEDCKPPPDVLVDEAAPSFGCQAEEHEDAAPVSATVDFPFRAEARKPPPSSPPLDEEGRIERDSDSLITRGRSGGVLIASYSPAEVSPSARFVLLRGERAEGDYIGFKILVLDRRDGAVYPLPLRTSPWPKRLRASRKGVRQIAVPVEKTEWLAAEMAVRWLGPAEQEVLLVDRTIVIPLKGSFELPGELVVARAERTPH